MTMLSAEKRRFCGGGGHGGGGGGMSQFRGYDFSSDLDCEMTTEEDNNDLRNDGGESSSKDEREEEWLQLGIGGGGGGAAAKNNGSGSGPVELELMPSSSGGHSQIFRPPPRPVMNSYLVQNPNLYSQQEINWGFRPFPISVAAPSSSSSLQFFPGRPFQIYAGVGAAPPPGAVVDFRVVQPPRRPHSGIWFMLQASHNQEKEPFLPQIAKSYLRIKDGRMTIRLVIKYLLKKLSLENESEIEIRCKGQKLLPLLTLQHVRDNIWSNSTSDQQHFITLLPNSSTSHHIMVLHYARTHVPSL